MRSFVYDVEVFAYDWLTIFKDMENSLYTIIHNDAEALQAFIDPDGVYIGFNSKSYDQFIIKAICNGAEIEHVKDLNDWLIGGNQGWEHPLMRGNWFQFNNVDIRDDVYKALSLKAIEGHLGMSVEESTVPFDLQRPLTRRELEETIRYCKHDVDATEKLVEIRKDYLKTKVNLGRRASIPDLKALAATNAKLTAMMLRAEKKEWTDGRDYVYPSALDVSVIPQPILDFFDTIHDKSIPDEKLFKTSFVIDIGGMLCKYAWGGVHGSLVNYHEEATDERVIQNRDVSSLYPSLIEIYNYLSRNVPDPELFYAIKRDRIQAKHVGDKQTAKDLKLPLNTVSGAQENQYNDLYDPLPTRSLRISGQLFLTVFAMRLLNACSTIRLLNLNTDGLMYSISKDELPIVDRISSEWEAETKFELETDDVQKVWIKDVNNLLMIKTDGEVKTVGSYLNYGISVKGAWSINNNMVIVKKALVEYFVNGTPVEDTINACDDIFQFQIIAKAGAKYREAYHMVDDEKHPVQKVNRVYATKDVRCGKLFKVKAETDAAAKIEMLPEHCLIDNTATDDPDHTTITQIDKDFYIAMAKKRINDFLGIKPEKIQKERKRKTMATSTKTPSIYKRLALVREKFLEVGIKKSGKNMQLKSMYFTLDDIVPVAMPLFHEQELLPLVNFTKDECTLRIADMNDEAVHIDFTAPMREYMGNAAVTPVQALGATITYMRRYLYQQALDIVEVDEMESGTLPTNAQPKSPANEVKREEIKHNLTNPDGNATELQISQLKKKLKELRAKCGASVEEWISQIAVETQAFTQVSRSRCEEILLEVGKKLVEG